MDKRGGKEGGRESLCSLAFYKETFPFKLGGFMGVPGAVMGG